MHAYREFWSKMFVFNATATRTQYWPAYLINILFVFIVALLTGQYNEIGNYANYNGDFPNNSFTFAIFTLLVWVANFTIRARRLHDSDHSNWWLLIGIIPLIGDIWLFVLLLLPSNPNSRWTVNQSDVD
ncbi:DUF805 domain-containing protein [Lentilactobacillus sp. Marseille-Q4993]|uniref:DUF805 domain-containing protein n=1 Tax=Lentilactobacillus sp. Marseille-Q4993 TaxID=3039492 RepID=UPI0024BC6292|nr:DUF805 domain-containing protein [Lentilactobacillus sp. Marseille-Q4993]